VAVGVAAVGGVAAQAQVRTARGERSRLFTAAGILALLFIIVMTVLGFMLG